MRYVRGVGTPASPRSFGWTIVERHVNNDVWETPTGERVLLDKGALLFRCPQSGTVMMVPPPPPYGSDPHLPFDPFFFDH